MFVFIKWRQVHSNLGNQKDYYPMNAYSNLHNSLSTDFETETLNHYTVALPTDYTRYYTNNYYIPITQNLQIQF